MLVGVDVVLLAHGVEHQHLTGFGGAEVSPGLVAAGGGDEPGQQGRLGETELVHRLAEVRLRRRAHPEGAFPQIDAVQVVEQDLVLANHTSELAGEHRLFNLPFQRALGAHVGVLYVLLRDGRATLDDLLAPDVGDQRSERA